jgi:hypothetical protein
VQDFGIYTRGVHIDELYSSQTYVLPTAKLARALTVTSARELIIFFI